VRRVAKASSVASTPSPGVSRGLFGLAAICVLGLAAFLESSAASAETACPNAAVREQQGSSFLPNCRAYEMVSPVEKSGSQAGLGTTGIPFYARASSDGEKFVYYTTGPVGEAVRGLQYFTTGSRTTTGWSSRATIPGPEYGITPNAISAIPEGLLVADDASRVAFRALSPFVTENPYSEELQGSTASYVTTPTGPIAWLTKPSIPSPEPEPGHLSGLNASVLEGGSRDLSTVYFGYCGTLTAADAPRAGRANIGFYVAEDGQISTAGVLPDGSVDPDGSIPAANFLGQGNQPCMGGAGEPPDPVAAYGSPVSADGDRALFVSPSPYSGSPRPSQLYVYRRGQASLLVSRSELTGQPSTTGVESLGGTFGYGSRTGPNVFLRTSDRLTSEAPSTPGPKLYRFNVETDDVVYLSGVYEGNGDPLAIKVASEDGSRVLLQSQLGPEPYRLAIWDEGNVVPVGTFSGGNAMDLHAHVSSDGSTFVFNSQYPFVGGTDTHQPGVKEVYRYVVGQAGPPTCISCVGPGETSAGPALLSNWAGISSQPQAGAILVDARNMSADAAHVFFDTPSALVPTDNNGKRDVYEWSDGSLSLVSTGNSASPTYLFDTSASGDDVFIATAEGIDFRDTDEAYDIYDARVGGGFIQTSSSPCAGSECQGAANSPPGFAPAGSATRSGPGNRASRSKRAKSRRHSPPRVLKARGNGTGVVLQVRTPSKGRIVATGDGLRTLRRSVPGAGSYSLSLKLTAKARGELSDGKGRQVRVRVKFTDSAGETTSTTVTSTVGKK